MNELEEFIKAFDEKDEEKIKALASQNPKLLKVVFEDKRLEIWPHSQNLFSPFLKKEFFLRERVVEKNVLMQAAEQGMLELVDFFNQKKVPLQNDVGISAIELAAQNGHLEVVNRLLKNSTYQSVGRALFMAIKNNQTEIIKKIEQAQKRPFFDLSFLIYANLRRNGGWKEGLKRNPLTHETILKKSKRRLLLDIIQDGNIKALKWLKSKGVDIFYDERKHLLDLDSLSQAVVYNKKKIASFLIEEGVDVNRLSRFGMAPLHYAARFDLKNMALLLIENGAVVDRFSEREKELDYQDKSKIAGLRMTPLMVASYSGALDTAKVLIENGADVNYQNINGQTALMMASQKGDKEMALLLLENGADIKKTDDRQNNALLLAFKAKDLTLGYWLQTKLEKGQAQEIMKQKSPLLEQKRKQYERE